MEPIQEGEKSGMQGTEEGEKILKPAKCENCGYFSWDICFLYLLRKKACHKKEGKS